MSRFRERLSHPFFQFVLAVGLGTLVAWVSGFFLTYHSDFGFSQYGLPLVWKTRVEYQQRTGLGVLSVPFSVTTYLWDAFIVDVLLYLGAFSSFILWRSRLSSWLRRVLIPVSGAWLSVIGLIFSWSSNYGTWTNGLPIPWMGLWNDGWFYNWTSLAMDTAIISTLEYLAFFLYEGLKMTVPEGPITQVFSRRGGSEKDA